MKKLNKEQLAAIKHGKGPLLVVAGAGTGKTTVITERIKYLVKKKLANPSEILALTFTEKAAQEMETRVDVAMPLGYTQISISTFHSFCDRVLRDESLHIGLNPKFTLLKQAEAIQFVRKNIYKFNLKYFRPLGNPEKFIEAMLIHFSKLQDEDITPDKYLRWFGKNKTRLRKSSDEARWHELVSAYKTYDELKIKNDYFDFGDLITKVLLLFRKRPNVLKEYHQKYKYILIDEFQDTNYAQNELALLLAGEKANITVVGDDDQSVYKFRGAAISNIMQFRKHFPKTKIVVLTKNYRSNQEILDKAYSLIQHNNPDRLEITEKINKKLISNLNKSTKIKAVKFIYTNRVEQEVESVVNNIIKLTKNKYKFSDIAILVRANSHAEPFAMALTRAGVPNQFLGPGKLFQQNEIANLIAYLKVLVNPEDSVAFFHFISQDHFKLPISKIQKLSNVAKKKNISLYEACQDSDDINIKNILKIIINNTNLIYKENVGRILYLYLEETNQLKKLSSPETHDDEIQVFNIAKFFDRINSFETNYKDAKLTDVIDWIELTSELGESPKAGDLDWPQEDAVNILTIHSAKGLEFPVVFLVNLVSQRFPTNNRSDLLPIPDSLIHEIIPQGDSHIQEERRLFYVGMTRAKEKLYITAADYYGEAKQRKKLSPFITETFGTEINFNNINLQNTDLIKYKQKLVKPKKIKLNKLTINYLSYSQISTFQICPLHYKMRYMLNIPTATTAALSFGNTIHNSLKDCYNTVNIKNINTKLINKIIKNNWEDEGYGSKAHKEEAFKKAKIIIKKYFDEMYNPKTKTISTEQSFLINLKGLKIGGRIDRIDKVGEVLEIIDYKTGNKIPDQKEVDRDLQLSIYALATAKKYKKIKLSLVYLDPLTIITTTRTKEDLMKAESEIFKIKKQIEESDFKCSNHPICNACEYALFCRSS